MSEDARSIDGTAPGNELSPLAIRLLRGMLFRDNDPQLWEHLIDLQARIRDYMSVLNLDLVIDEAEGYAFLRSRPDEDNEDGRTMPRLIVRRPLSFPVSLLLALLRKKLVESDAVGGDTRLVLSRDEIVEMVRVFLPENSNEARLIDRLDSDLNRIVELGFLRRMNAPGTERQARSFEVQRFLRAFVDAQWLGEFESRLAAYRTELEAAASE